MPTRCPRPSVRNPSIARTPEALINFAYSRCPRLFASRPNRIHVGRLALLGFGHLQDARALEIRISEQAALEEDDLASCIAG